MFVALRDLRFAKGRFALIGVVVVLITMLIGLLSGLTSGLGRANTSAITGLGADHVAFAAPPGGQQPSFTTSSLSESAWLTWRERPGVTSAEPVGIRTLDAIAGDRAVAVAAFGIDPAAPFAPASLVDGSVVSAPLAAELDVRVGDVLRVGGLDLHISDVGGEDAYSHLPVVWTSLSAWQRLGPGDAASVVALRTDGADLAAGDAAAGTRTLTVDDALTMIGSYQAENGSLQLMRGFLFAISALVIGAFFTVWTVQRGGDIAVLKALGASTGYLLRDALGQALLLLLAGTGVGMALAAAIGAVVRGSDVPFVLDATTIALPAGVVILLGVIGAALPIRRITTVDPLDALGSAR
ncbi:ABC transporter permease [Haloechinothrix salitolerans]|uniref:ABC transporter permease n=1 Tax=Haloechinothrix salitolerans TaxID=926830 RepID=A0ABW2C0S5_9PSEU